MCYFLVISFLSYHRKEHYGFVALPLVKQGITVAVINFANAPKGYQMIVCLGFLIIIFAKQTVITFQYSSNSVCNTFKILLYMDIF